MNNLVTKTGDIPIAHIPQFPWTDDFGVRNRKPEETHEAIESHTAAFLAAGGSIEQIPIGKSGQVTKSGPGQITLGSARQRAKKEEMLAGLNDL